MSEKWRTLKAGDRIRLLCVPESDLQQRERELREGIEGAGLTANTLERIIKLDPVVIIDRVEYELPMFDYEFVGDDGFIEYHTIGICEYESWERLNL
jgi:hypothetical protein